MLNGEKSWISLADVADNFLVFAWTDLEKKKPRDPSGMSAFIVERTFKGFSSGPMKEKWGILAGNTGFFKMDDVEVPEENLVGQPGRGLQDRDVRARSGALHRGGRRDRPHPRVPRRERQLREGAQDLRRRDRPAPAGEGNDRADGVRLSGGAAAVAARPAGSRTTAGATRAKPASRNGSPPSRPSGRPATPSRFTAPTATRTSIRSAASIATARARSSTKARARSTS